MLGADSSLLKSSNVLSIINLRCNLTSVSPHIVQRCCVRNAEKPVPLPADNVIQANSESLILLHKLVLIQRVSCLLHATTFAGLKALIPLPQPFSRRLCSADAKGASVCPAPTDIDTKNKTSRQLKGLLSIQFSSMFVHGQLRCRQGSSPIRPSCGSPNAQRAGITQQNLFCLSSPSPHWCGCSSTAGAPLQWWLSSFMRSVFSAAV